MCTLEEQLMCTLAWQDARKKVTCRANFLATGSQIQKFFEEFMFTKNLTEKALQPALHNACMQYVATEETSCATHASMRSLATLHNTHANQQIVVSSPLE